MTTINSARKRVNIANFLLDHAMILIILLLAVYVTVRVPAFAKIPNIINLVKLSAARLPMALGVAGCIILAGTDLSGGRVAGFAGFLAAVFLQASGDAARVIAGGQPWPVALVILAVMAAGACVGVINGFCMGKFKLHPFIVTLATQLMVYGSYLTVSNSKQIAVNSFVTNPMFEVSGQPVPYYVLMAAVITGIIWVIWNKTTFGKNIFAVGSNEEAARVSGVNVLLTIVCVFIMAGALYGYTGFIEACRIGNSGPTLGLSYENDAISAVVIGGVSFVGGTGKISGVILGVFMMQLIMTAMTFLGISGGVAYIIKGAVILIACILDMRKYMTKK